ncbi:MAG: ribosomal RNA small subunit methyltransferase A [Candidatus Tectomicrobia bacterium]|nr:ribosomal RNA small subunit methyltransferase A [Candidatus Tectomicrobia bacterium]
MIPRSRGRTGARRQRRPSARLRRRQGRHFLRRPEILAEIAALAGIGPRQTVLEIGCGEGFLTAALAEQACKVLAVEVDRRLIEVARRNLLPAPNVALLCADILSLDLRRLPPGIVAVGNLPYSIATPIIFRCLEHLERFASLTFTVQLEVAERLVAKPATKPYSVLSVAVQLRCHVEALLSIPRRAFSPPPRVDSAVVRFLPLREPPVPAAEQPQLLRVVRTAFAQRRKTLRNALLGAGWLDWRGGDIDACLQRLGIAPQRRGETLSLAEFAALARAVPRPPAGRP